MNPLVMDIAHALLAAGLLLALFRLIRGPSLPDRVVALEITSMLSIGLILLQVIETRAGLFMDVAVILALVAFLGTVGFAYYAERQARP
jgi:multicomponent Na+:H+ antiporter subunit F